MLFNSATYIFFFLPLVFCIWMVLVRFGFGQLIVIFLTAASWFFYAWWYPPFLLLLLTLLVFNYGMARAIAADTHETRRWLLVVLGIGANLLVLFWFKYIDFALGNLVGILGETREPFKYALPLGISFMTFQKIAYLSDIYRGKTHDTGFWRFCLFVSFFPQLIAGPIVHHAEVMPQFADPANRRVNFENIGAGLFLFTIGLFKKVVLADSFAVWVKMVFDDQSDPTMVEAWIGALSYAFQIYWDFSGYTDMAIGAALLFNIWLPINFNSPYKSADLADFWTRWHITLGRWFREYLYIPLGGNRFGKSQTLRNLFVVMFLGGLWHGASWTFVLWGLLHGAGLAIHRLWSALQKPLPRVLAVGTTFIFVVFAWIPFRAVSIADAVRIWRGMLGMEETGFSSVHFEKMRSALDALLLRSSDNVTEALPWLIVASFIVFAAPNSMQMLGFAKSKSVFVYSPNSLAQPLAMGLILFGTVILMLLSRSTEFIYFNF
jgi:alginate O-acetyltransferase complex protein AlgI